MKANSLAATSISSLQHAKLNPGQALHRVALVCDLLEEEWPSMDLVAEMIFQHLELGHSHDFTPVLLRPSLPARFRRMPLVSRSRFARNADRLLNRMSVYPRWLNQRARDFDLFHLVDHSYGQLAFELPPERTVVTCHDLNTFRCLLQPEVEPRPRWFRMMTQRILDGMMRCVKVICVSEAVRDEILSYGLLPGSRLAVVHNGAHPNCSPEPDAVADAVAERLLGLDLAQSAPPPPYLLHVGSTTPRKRIDVLLKVFAAVRKEVPATRLIRVGGPFTPAQEELSRQLGVRAAIDVLPFLDRNVLSSLYRRATAVLQPSDAEGFGLPVVESLACGCPVIASDIPVLREVGGSAVTFCPVGDVPAWTAAAVKLLDRSCDTASFNEHRQSALKQATGFTWAATAKKLAEIYGQILETKKGE